MVNSREFARWDVHEPRFELDWPMPADIPGSDGSPRIGFTIGHPGHPANSKDPRLLGLGLQQTEIRPSTAREREG